MLSALFPSHSFTSWFDISVPNCPGSLDKHDYFCVWLNINHPSHPISVSLCSSRSPPPPPTYSLSSPPPVVNFVCFSHSVCSHHLHPFCLFSPHMHTTKVFFQRGYNERRFSLRNSTTHDVRHHIICTLIPKKNTLGKNTLMENWLSIFNLILLSFNFSNGSLTLKLHLDHNEDKLRGFRNWQLFLKKANSTDLLSRDRNFGMQCQD